MNLILAIVLILLAFLGGALGGMYLVRKQIEKEFADNPRLNAEAVAQRKQQKPNIIYIMWDDMGYGDLGCYGQKYILTPNIDRMAKEGMRFTQAYAGAPVSAPSRACFMTGHHSGHTEVRGNKELPL